MPSTKPQDFGKVLMPPDQAAQVQRLSFNVGQWTANTTKTTLLLGFDRAAVIREVWLSADAVPADSDGTMLVDVIVRDWSEAADDVIVNDFDGEASLTTAKKAVKATLAAETSENELTVAAGDSLLVSQISNSAAIDTNANLVVTVLFQTIAALE